jgi:uncharacterized protein involved in type VI secretion and phage assembly
MKPLYLIACSMAKLDHAAPAAQLYTGQAFKLAMRAAKAANADVLILSALHGVLEPDDVINPYDCYLGGLPKTDRAIWAITTAAQLAPYRERFAVILAGKHYAAACDDFTNKREPLKGLGIGRQLSFLKNAAQFLTRT